MFTAQTNFIIALSLLALGAIGSLILQKKDRGANLIDNICAIIASLFGITSALQVIFFKGNFALDIASNFPLLSFSIKSDLLSALFTLIISTIALLASIYGLGYVKQYFGKYNIGGLGFFYNTFIIGMLLVVTAHNALFFLIVWEIMSVASYFLVIFEKDEKKNIEAGTLYFIMTHAGTAFITLAFLLLYKYTGSFDFGIITQNINQVPALAKDIIFIFALVGFGTKAGIIPFHIWLPSAHPAAPSHVSALMSGVMIKTGVFMLIRILFDFMPTSPIWWGITILIIGAISSLFGVLYALTEHDIKKLLAYHSIENIGIILLGVGSALIFNTLGYGSLATLSLVAALFHTFNHAIFKALLFMGAGSVISQTHTKNIEAYGGLIKLMPITALFFLIGSMAISALPPFNGFASEWLTFQSLFAGLQIADKAQWAFVVGAGSLAFTGGLAAACFVKVFGITFLARPRSDKAKMAKESSTSLQIGMGALATLALLFGIFSGTISQILVRIAESLNILRNSISTSTFQFNHISTPNNFGTISLASICTIIVLVILFVYILIRIISGKRKIREEITWDCGTDLGPRMEITATGFSRSIITIFRNILQPTKEMEIEFDEANPKYFAQKSTVNMEVRNVYQRALYQPLHELIAKLSEFAKATQSGNVNGYILYIFVVLIILLISGVIK